MSELVLPPQLHDRVNDLRNPKNSRVHRDNIYNSLLDITRSLMKACEEYEKNVIFKRK